MTKKAAAAKSSAAKKPKMLIAGNWKMNGLRRDLSQITQLDRQLNRSRPALDIAICPPATLLGAAAALTPKIVKLGGQDCHPQMAGAHTGDISAEMIKNIGGRYVIVGHSERRQDHGESNALVAAKAEAALKAGLVAIICVGETLSERTKKQTLRVIGRQLQQSIPDRAEPGRIVVAYEPVWAIGSGLTPTHGEIEQAHGHLRKGLVEKFGPKGAAIRLLYGGSVKPDNAAEILKLTNVNGALVGGASLKASDFIKIIKSAV